MKSLMKKTVCGLVLVAASSMAMADNKIGVVDVRQVLQKIPQMNAIKAQLTSQFKPREEKIVAAQKALQAQIDKLNKDGATMTENDRNQLQDKIIADKAALQGMMTTFERDLTNAQNREMQAVLKKISDNINQIGKDGKYSIILQSDAAAYSDSSLDITQEVVTKLSAKK